MSRQSFFYRIFLLFYKLKWHTTKKYVSYQTAKGILHKLDYPQSKLDYYHYSLDSIQLFKDVILPCRECYLHKMGNIIPELGLYWFKNETYLPIIEISCLPLYIYSTKQDYRYSDWNVRLYEVEIFLPEW